MGSDPTRAGRRTKEQSSRLSRAQEWNFSIWDFANGTWGKGVHIGDPAAPLKALAAEHTEEDPRRVAILHNFHKFLSNPMVLQELANRLVTGKADGITICVLSPITQIPIELEPLFTVLEHNLPDKEELAKIATDLDESASANIASAAAGLTRLEAENTFALSLVRNQSIRHDEIWQEKAAQLKKTGLLSLCTTGRRLRHAQRHGRLQAVLPGSCTDRHSHKGVLLLGVPRTSKNAFARRLGAAPSSVTAIHGFRSHVRQPGRTDRI